MCLPATSSVLTEGIIMESIPWAKEYLKATPRRANLAKNCISVMSFGERKMTNFATTEDYGGKA